MDTNFSFIHAADLHIGTPFTSIARADQEIVDSLIRSTFQAFDAMIDLALEKQVDFVLLAGDLFDSSDRNLKAVLHFRNGMQKLEQGGIQVFIVHGNHDPMDQASGMLELPPNCTVFPASKAKWKAVQNSGRPVAAVCGLSFPTRSVEENLAVRIPSGPEGLFRIVLLHCTVGNQAGHYPYAPCSLADLVERHDANGRYVDYWALGHVHSAAVLCRQPWVVYPGVIQGRSFREQGEKGVFLVQSSGRQVVALDFHSVDSVRWLEVEIDASGARDIGALMDAARNEIGRVCRQAGSRGRVIRLVIAGRSPVAADLGQENSIPDMLEELREEFAGRRPLTWVESIINRCRRPVDLEERKTASDIVAFILQEADAIRGNPERQAAARKELSVLLGRRDIRRHCRNLSGNTFEQLLEDAEFMLLDRLEE